MLLCVKRCAGIATCRADKRTIGIQRKPDVHECEYKMRRTIEEFEKSLEFVTLKKEDASRGPGLDLESAILLRQSADVRTGRQ